jgi:hypothetical protein
MPYVRQERREELDNGAMPATSGDLNYLITCQVKTYLEGHGTSYTIINDIIGALEGAKIEFYRRIAEPYENTKIVANGDVYP